MARQLSKSDFLMFLKHPGLLWYKKFEPDKLPPISDDLQARFDAGKKFESYAEQLFSGGQRIEGDYFERDTATTRALIGGAQTLFQAKFTGPDNTACISDVLVRASSDSFDLYEIKTSTQPRTDHVWDLAFQKHVIEACGYTVKSTAVVHVNPRYVREGEIDITQLVSVSDVTDEVHAAMSKLSGKLKAAFEVITSGEQPNMSPRLASYGGMYDWLPLYKTLHPELPANSIYNLCRLKPELVAEFEDAGVQTFEQIPTTMLAKLVPAQQQQILATKAGQPLAKTKEIAKFMGKIQFPFYFLDYETAADVVPLYDGTRSYQQIPMQFSLHVLPAPSEPLQHYEFLHSDQTNPMPPLIDKLREFIGPQGSIAVWYKAFEGGCHADMAKIYPEHEDFLLGLNRRMIDLMDPFAKQWYVDAGFKGSASIKNVLPVLAPDLSYKTLGIQNGGAAQGSWMKAVFGEATKDEQAEVFANLIDYCKLDTLAMVRIYEFLAELTDGMIADQPSLF